MPQVTFDLNTGYAMLPLNPSTLERAVARVLKGF